MTVRLGIRGLLRESKRCLPQSALKEALEHIQLHRAEQMALPEVPGLRGDF